MRFQRHTVVTPKLVKIGAAVIIGLSIGMLVPPKSVVLPVIGRVSGVLVGGSGLVLGVTLYTQLPKLVAPSGCDCSGKCGCS